MCGHLEIPRWWLLVNTRLLGIRYVPSPRGNFVLGLLLYGPYVHPPYQTKVSLSVILCGTTKLSKETLSFSICQITVSSTVQACYGSVPPCGSQYCIFGACEFTWQSTRTFCPIQRFACIPIRNLVMEKFAVESPPLELLPLCSHPRPKPSAAILRV